MRLALLAITAAAALAQSPEIRGIVVERSSGAGLPGVEVTLTASPVQAPRIVATTFTDADGNFRFKPDGFGQYGVEAKKPGYTSSRAAMDVFMGTSVFLSSEFPVWEHRIVLMNPSTITGRFVDEQDRPLSGLRIVASSVITTTVLSATTGADGTFTTTNVPSGSYLIRALQLAAGPKIEEYADQAFEGTGETYEDLFWPTGVADASSALPLVVSPGATSDVGTMRLRRADLYRARLNIQGDCSGDAWTLALIDLKSNGATQLRTSCKQHLLLTGVPEGSYQVALWSDGDNNGWAIAPLTITRRNTVLNLTIVGAAEIPGRMMTSQGVPPPPFPGNGFQLMMRPDYPSLSTVDAQEPQVQADGTFVAHSMRWDRYRVSAPRVPAPYYVREIRYNGRALADGRITLVPGARLEFELDNQPALISGSLTSGGQPFTGQAGILLAKAPYDVPDTVGGNAPYSYRFAARNGRFEISGLAPGEYRIAVFTDASQLPPIQDGQKITLEHGEQRALELKLK